MIYFICGVNTKASYDRLKSIESNFKGQEKIKLDKEHSYEDLAQAVFTTSLLADTKLVVAQNFIKDKKIDFKTQNWQKEIEDKTVVFYETTPITPSALSHLPKHFKIEVFKLEPKIFQFLDSINPSAQRVLRELKNAQVSKDSSFLWNIANRFLLLTLAKKGLNSSQAGTLTGRNIAPWQWQKISSQAGNFNLSVLKKLSSGTLKIDYLIKTGKTQLSAETLVTYLLLKYLNP